MDVSRGFWWVLCAPLLLVAVSEAAEEDLYDFLWLDKDKKVFVLQNKIHKKDGTNYFNVAYVHDLSSPYQDASGFQVAYGNYLSEQWALEAFYHSYSSKNSEDHEKVKETARVHPFTRKSLSKMGLVFLWAPFYGKINTFNKILYFDWAFGIGGGLIQGQDNADTVAFRRQEDRYEDRSYTSLMTKTAVRLYAGRGFYATLEYHFDLYNAQTVTVGRADAGKRLISNGEVAFGVGMGF